MKIEFWNSFFQWMTMISLFLACAGGIGTYFTGKEIKDHEDSVGKQKDEKINHARSIPLVGSSRIRTFG